MSELEPRAGWTNEEAAELYGEHGREDVDTRQLAYTCLAPGYELIDPEMQTISAIQHVWASENPMTMLDGTIVDVGSSVPKFLDTWQIIGHLGRLVAIEPNTAQLQGLPYWAPRNPDDPEQTAEELRQLAEYRERYRAQYGYDLSGLGRIEIIQASADRIPLPTGEARAVTLMFSIYHMLSKLHEALVETKRIQDPNNGLLAIDNRGNRNKRTTRGEERRLQTRLSVISDRVFRAPSPINLGCTSEKTRSLLPKYYSHVYERRLVALLKFGDPRSVPIRRAGHLTLLNGYKDENGNPPSLDLFEQAFEEELGEEYALAESGEKPIYDEKHESIFMAADRPLDLPKDEDGNELFKLVA